MFYVTDYEQRWTSGPEEGGWSASGYEVQWSKPFKSKKDAIDYLEKCADFIHADVDMERLQVGEEGDEEVVRIETDSNRADWHNPPKTWAEYEGDVEFEKPVFDAQGKVHYPEVEKRQREREKRNDFIKKIKSLEEYGQNGKGGDDAPYIFVMDTSVRDDNIPVAFVFKGDDLTEEHAKKFVEDLMKRDKIDFKYDVVSFIDKNTLSNPDDGSAAYITVYVPIPEFKESLRTKSIKESSDNGLKSLAKDIISNLDEFLGEINIRSSLVHPEILREIDDVMNFVEDYAASVNEGLKRPKSKMNEAPQIRDDDTAKKRQLINNITALVNEYYDMITKGSWNPFTSTDEFVDYTYNEVFDVKDDGKGYTEYGTGICDDLKSLGKDYIVSEIIRIGNEAGVVDETGEKFRRKPSTGKTKIKDFYIAAYPKDELGIEIDETVTFDDLYNGMKNGEDAYDIIGVGDSIVRERVFSELADIKNVDYDVIYDMWLDTAEPIDTDFLIKVKNQLNKNESARIKEDSWETDDLNLTQVEDDEDFYIKDSERLDLEENYETFDNSEEAKRSFIDYCNGRVESLGDIATHYSSITGDTVETNDILLEYPDNDARKAKYLIMDDFGEKWIVDKDGNIIYEKFSVLDDIENRTFNKIDSAFYDYCLDRWSDLRDWI